MTEDLIKNKRILSSTLIQELENEKWDNIIPENLILNCNKKLLNDYKWLANDKLELLSFLLKDTDDKVILKMFNEFVNETDLSILEKLKELIIVKCELHQLHKIAFQSLQEEFIFKPQIMLSFLYSFQYLTNQSLILFGDNDKNFKKFIRKHSISFIFFNIFLNWLSSKDDDLSSIMKVVDEHLNNAREAGNFFGII